MKALVYQGPGLKALEDRPKPEIQAPGDAIVKIVKTTISGTDLHILKGDVATCARGRILGHEGAGVIESVGAACTRIARPAAGFWAIRSTARRPNTFALRTPHADTSLYPIPEGADEEALVMLSDILPTGFECGVLNGKVAPGSTVAIVGSGPIGLAALVKAQFYAPSEIIMIPMLLKTVQSKRIDAGQLITHRFKLDQILEAYETFGKAADTKALKVIIEA